MKKAIDILDKAMFVFENLNFGQFLYNGGYATQKQRHNCTPKIAFLFVTTETSEKPLTFETH